MRGALPIVFGVCVILKLTSCASAPTIDGIPIYGHTQLLPSTELRAVIAADQSSPSNPTSTIYALEIVSSTEVNVHHAPWNPGAFEYNEIRKIRGKWRKPNDRVIGGRVRYY